jgi:hypothetical protein
MMTQDALEIQAAVNQEEIIEGLYGMHFRDVVLEVI